MRLRRVFWDIGHTAPAGSMWETPPATSALSENGLEELEEIFVPTSTRKEIAKADAAAEAEAARLESSLNKINTKEPVDASALNLVALALGEKRAFALHLLYGSLRVPNDECITAIAALDPGNEAFVSKLPVLSTLYNLVSRKSDLDAIERKAAELKVLEERK